MGGETAPGNPGGGWRALAVDLALAGLAGTLLGLAFAPRGVAGLAWVALAPLFFAIGRQRSPLGGFLVALAAGLVFVRFHLAWFLEVEGFTGSNSILCHLGLSACIAGFGAVAGHLACRLPRWNALTFPAAWVVAEYASVHAGFLSSPWQVVGYTQYAFLPVAGIAAFTGVLGVSFLVATVNAVLAEAAGARVGSDAWRPWTSPGLIGAGLVLTAGGVLAASSHPSHDPAVSLRVALVQAGFYHSSTGDQALRRSVFDAYAEQTRAVAVSAPDLVVWPAAAVPANAGNRSVARVLSRLVRESGAALLVGSSGHDKAAPGKTRKRYANSAFLFSPEGRIVGRYDKMRLVPFNEYLPLRGRFPWPDWLVPPLSADAMAGSEPTIFRVGEASFGVKICLENMYSEDARLLAAQGIDFMVSLTNEAFTSSAAGRHHMLVLNVFRAIENHVAVARAATTGISAVIGPDGRILARLEDDRGEALDVHGRLIAQVPLSRERTFYTRHGDWLVAALGALMLGALLAARSQRRPAGPSPTEGSA